MRIHASSGEVTLTEADDLGRLSLAVVPPRETAVGGWARWVDDDHVAVAPEVLLALAGPRAADPAWRTGFDRMVAYATSRGWVDDQGHLRVHVEPAPRDGLEAPQGRDG